ncbi:MAG: P-type conjugative transfer ATPase TrbB [Gammaproteobacteria bacterium]|nr:P-type conjugative transfer ATPase TrbB [Gammaproteobacteria bacterium]
MSAVYLWQKLGATIQAGLTDPTVLEIMLNPDERLWFMYRKTGTQPVGVLESAQSSAFVHALAQYHQAYLNAKKPYLDATLPFHGERIQVTVPPVSQNIAFTIRKKAKQVFTLEDYFKKLIVTKCQVKFLVDAIKNRKNILISGSPASGKTTLINALLDTLAKEVSEGHRVLILEQLPELQCAVANTQHLLTTGSVSMQRLVWLAMRQSPDRIVVGEVRDGAALDLLKAWNTGCPGGMATIHANHPKAALQRLLDLACEVVVNPPYHLVNEAVDVIVQIDRCANHPARRVVTSIVEVLRFNAKTKTFDCRALKEPTD